MVILGGILQENPFFVPPDEFLRELREREGPGSPASTPPRSEGMRVAPDAAGESG